MATFHVNDIEGEQIRFNDDTWELTGDIDVLQNGDVLKVTARKPERVRGNTAMISFKLQNPPASINPGNLGDIDVEVERTADGIELVVTRRHTSNRYRAKNLTYS